jgi:hypothetical protein
MGPIQQDVGQQVSSKEGGGLEQQCRQAAQTRPLTASLLNAAVVRAAQLQTAVAVDHFCPFKSPGGDAHSFLQAIPERRRALQSTSACCELFSEFRPLLSVAQSLGTASLAAFAPTSATVDGV